jgi:uncharacterized protein
MVKGKDELNKILRTFIELISRSFNISAVVLFGSYATDTPKDYSDIDIAVFSPDFGHNPLEEMAHLCRLRRSIDTDIEPLPFSTDDFYHHTKADFIYEILKNGRVIYKDGIILV